MKIENIIVDVCTSDAVSREVVCAALNRALEGVHGILATEFKTRCGSTVADCSCKEVKNEAKPKRKYTRHLTVFKKSANADKKSANHNRTSVNANGETETVHVRENGETVTTRM